MRVYIVYLVYFFLSEMSSCIQAEDILIELRLIRALIVSHYFMEKKESGTEVNTGPKTVVEEKEEQGSSQQNHKTTYEDHIPAWDILDSDFDNFPAMPVNVGESITFSSSVSDNNFGVFNEFALTIVKLHNEHTIVFIGSAVGIIVVLTAICCFLIWFCCRKCKGSYDLQQPNEMEMDKKDENSVNVDQSCSTSIESNSFQEGVADLPQLDENMFDEIFEPREVKKRKITEL